MGEMRNEHKIMDRKLKGRRPLGSPMHRWEDNIRMDLQEIEYKGVDWMQLAQDRDQWQALVNTVMNIQVQ
jgi:hypothetical protein